MIEADVVIADEARTEAAAKIALAAALKEFEGLGQTLDDPKRVMRATLRAFAAVEFEREIAYAAFSAEYPASTCIFDFNARHIVLSAFWAFSTGGTADDTHPYCMGADGWRGVVAACIALHAASDFRAALDGEQYGTEDADLVLAEFPKADDAVTTEEP